MFLEQNLGLYYNISDRYFYAFAILFFYNDVTAVDIVEAKVDKINAWKSPIQDEYIEKFMAEHDERGLSFVAATDAAGAYADADFIIIAAPTRDLFRRD